MPKDGGFNCQCCHNSTVPPLIHNGLFFPLLERWHQDHLPFPRQLEVGAGPLPQTPRTLWNPIWRLHSHSGYPQSTTHTLSLSLSLSHSVTKHTQTHTKGPDGDLSNLSTHVGQAPYLVCAACHNHRHLWFTQQQCGVSHINKSKISCFMVNTFTSVGLWLLSHSTFSFLWLYFFLLRSS